MGKSSSKFIQVQIPVASLNNPDKYTGRNRIIDIKSSWELSFLKFLDSTQGVLGYTYEEMPIEYVSPIDRNSHRYWIDFHVKAYGADNKIKESLIEIKPFYEAQHALTGKVEFKTKVSEKEQREVLETASINHAKWKAAQEFCRRNGYKFVILTEMDIVLSGILNRDKKLLKP